MAYHQQLERILEIDRQIRAGRYPNAEQLAGAMGLSKRLIFNDKRFMVERLNAPIAFDHERGGWYYTEPGWTPPPMFATEGELLAFFLSAEVAQRYADTPYAAPLRAAVDKLAAGLGGHIRVRLDQLSAAAALAAPEPAPPWPGARPPDRPAVLMDLQRAIRRRQAVRLRYYTAGRDEHTERTIQPCLLYQLHGHWHVFGYDQLRGEMRNFRADRIESWQVLEPGAAGAGAREGPRPAG